MPADVGVCLKPLCGLLSAKRRAVRMHRTHFAGLWQSDEESWIYPSASLFSCKYEFYPFHSRKWHDTRQWHGDALSLINYTFVLFFGVCASFELADFPFLAHKKLYLLSLLGFGSAQQVNITICATVSSVSGHGIGVKSMVSVVDRYQGVYGFFAEDGEFRFQASM